MDGCNLGLCLTVCLLRWLYPSWPADANAACLSMDSLTDRCTAGEDTTVSHWNSCPPWISRLLLMSYFLTVPWSGIHKLSPQWQMYCSSFPHSCRHQGLSGCPEGWLNEGCPRFIMIQDHRPAHLWANSGGRCMILSHLPRKFEMWEWHETRWPLLRFDIALDGPRRFWAAYILLCSFPSCFFASCPLHHALCIVPLPHVHWLMFSCLMPPCFMSTSITVPCIIPLHHCSLHHIPLHYVPHTHVALLYGPLHHAPCIMFPCITFPDIIFPSCMLRCPVLTPVHCLTNSCLRSLSDSWDLIMLASCFDWAR